MKTKLLLIVLLIANFTFFSCKKDKKDNELSVPFSNTDPEVDKAKIEQNGQEFVAELSNFKDEKGIEALNSFSSFLSNSSSTQKAVNSNTIIGGISKLKSASVNKDAKGIFNTLSTLSNDPQTLQEAWDQIKGIYTWNSITQQWDTTASSTVAEFHFPSTENGTSNNAVFTISSYKGVTITSPIEDYNGDLPTELKANLTVDGTEVSTFSFSASYNSQGIPSKIVTSISFGQFVFTYEFNNTSSNISVNYLFKKDTKVILDFGAGTNGNFTEDNINNAQSPEEVIYNANAHFQLFNVRLAGMIDFKKIIAAEKDIDSKNLDSEISDSLYVNAINSNMQLIGYFTDTQKKFADLKAYMYTSTYYDYYYGYTTETNIGLRFVFFDGSKADAETYFGNGFDALVTDINNLIDELNTKYGTDISQVN